MKDYDYKKERGMIEKLRKANYSWDLIAFRFNQRKMLTPAQHRLFGKRKNRAGTKEWTPTQVWRIGRKFGIQ